MKTLWTLDGAHSSANFSIKHMMIAKVHGGFEKISGTFTYDAVDPKNSIVLATIETASISTRDAQRDGHLKSADFFDVEKYPTITFASSNIERVGSE